jgi:hypothetical protein
VWRSGRPVPPAPSRDSHLLGRTLRSRWFTAANVEEASGE